jgi:hypothetical protein
LFVDTEYENSGPEASGLEFENLEIWKFENWMLRVNWSRSVGILRIVPPLFLPRIHELLCF